MRVACLLCLLAGCAKAPTSPLPEPPEQREAASLAPLPTTTAAAAKSATPAADAAVSPKAPQADSTSLGSVSNGRLVNGAALSDTGPGFRFNDRRKSEARYATHEVIAAIQRAALRVSQRFPASELVINDLSLPQGGRIAHHGSHRAGRDADILFYLRGDDGAFTRSVGTPIDPDGIGFDFKELSRADDDVRVHFDAERTWLFVAALLEDESAVVQRIFVAEHLRTMLLKEAGRIDAPRELVARFADVTCQPSYPHDDHLHVRWFCSLEDLREGCEDLPPLYPFRQAALEAAGVAPVLATQSRAKDPAPITTQQEAHANVVRQKPHPLVLAFLKRRKAWEKQPHPGRPYCR